MELDHFLVIEVAFVIFRAGPEVRADGSPSFGIGAGVDSGAGGAFGSRVDSGCGVSAGDGGIPGLDSGAAGIESGSWSLTVCLGGT